MLAILYNYADNALRLEDQFFKIPYIFNILINP